MAKKDDKSTTVENEQQAVTVEQSKDNPGGVQTVDPAFADGAQEVDQWSNQPKDEPKKK